jgi:hypothetical protein
MRIYIINLTIILKSDKMTNEIQNYNYIIPKS